MNVFEKSLEKYRLFIVVSNFFLSSLFFILLFRLANQNIQSDMFGHILIAISLTSIIRILDGGIFIAATSIVAKSNEPIKKFCSIVNAYSCLLIVFLPTYYLILVLLDDFSSLSDTIIMLFGLFFFTSTFSSLIQILFDAFHWPRIRLIISSISFIFGILLIVFIDININTYILTQIVTHLLIILICISLIIKNHKNIKFFLFNFYDFFILIKTTIKFQINNLSSFSLDPFTKIALGSINLSYVVAYEAANQVFGKVKLLILSYLNIALPGLAKNSAKRARYEFIKILSKTSKLIIFGGLPFVCLFPIGYNFLIAESVVSNYNYIALVAIFYFISFFFLPFHIFFVARLNSYGLFMVQIPLFIGAILIFILNQLAILDALILVSLSYTLSGLTHIYFYKIM